MLQFFLSTYDSLMPWRDLYFDSLSHSQDMYSESMISWMSGATSYLIDKNNASIGYFILNNSNELMEFFIQDDQLTEKENLFMTIIEQFGIKSVYCKSFDLVLLSYCLTYSRSNKLVGYLFEYSHALQYVSIDSKLSVRLATLDDVSFLNSFDNEILEEGEEITPYVKNNSVYMFMSGEELIGCGYLFNVIPGRKYYDVGMWVNKPYRGKGYASQIISYLTKYCLENDFVPTAGCATNNIASRRTLEKCGFISRLCLINFEFNA